MTILYFSDDMLEKILQLGNPLLYEPSELVEKDEIPKLANEIEVLHQLILEVRKEFGFGRGIAAPQIGLMKHVVCLNLSGKKCTLFNPSLTNLSKDQFELWDDCMSFPNLLVKVSRHKSCTLTFRDENWNHTEWFLEDDLSELLQHECDHLAGILATQRAIDNKSFRLVRK